MVVAPMLVPLLLRAPVAEGPAVPDPPGTSDSPEEPEAGEARNIVFVWEAGGEPITPGSYMEAVMMRLPPGRFHPVGPDSDDAWKVRVSQPQAGVYRLEVAPPDRRAQARRLYFEDPEDARRRLAILTAFALEQGEFPPVVEGSGVVEDDPEEPLEPPDTMPAEPPASVVESGGPRERARRSSPRVHPVVELGAKVGLVSRTDASSALSNPAWGATLGVGLVALRWLWVAGVADFAQQRTPLLRAERYEGGLALGIRPEFGRWHFGAQLAALGGTSVGRFRGARESDPFAAGRLAVGTGWRVPGRSGLGLFIAASGELASRSSTFVLEISEESLAVGRVRGGFALGVFYAGLKGRNGS